MATLGFVLLLCGCNSGLYGYGGGSYYGTPDYYGQPDPYFYRDYGSRGWHDHSWQSGSSNQTFVPRPVPPPAAPVSPSQGQKMLNDLGFKADH